MADAQMWDSEGEEVEKKSFKDYIVDYAPLIIAGLFMFFFHGRLGVSIHDTALFYGFAGIFGWVFLKSVWQSWENATPKIVYNYGFGTTDGELIPAGNYFVVQRAIKAFHWYLKLAGCYVFPLDALTKEGPNIVIRARMEKVIMDEIPRTPKSVIWERKIKEPYYLGFANEENYADTMEDKEKITGVPNPSVTYLITEIKEMAKENSFLRRIQKGKLQDVESLVEFGRRVGKPQTLTDKLKNALLSEKKEEGE